MAAYLLLIVAACWHALGIGTQGHRGRIVHTITAAGMAWGAITPPWGWIGIGAAVGTVMGVRWLVTPDGREFLRGAGVLAVQLLDAFVRLLGRTVRWVLPPRTHEGPAVQLWEPVPTPRDTLGSRMASTPPAHLFEPEAWKRGTAEPVSVDTYSDIVGSVAAGTYGYNDGARYVHTHHQVSRSKFARDVRALREEAA